MGSIVKKAEDYLEVVTTKVITPNGVKYKHEFSPSKAEIISAFGKDRIYQAMRSNVYALHFNPQRTCAKIRETIELIVG